MDDHTTTENEPKQGVGFRVLAVVASLIPGLFLLWILLMSGFIIFVPVVAFLFWLFRHHRRNSLRSVWKIGATLFVTSIALSGFLIWGMFRSTRRPDRYLIPQGYVGWVIVEYNVKGASPLPLEEGYDLYKIPHGGRLQTSSPLEGGVASDEYFYVGVKGRQVIKITGWGEGGMIWGGSTSDGKIGVGDKNGTRTVQTPATQTFFVGTEQQFQKAGAEPNSQQMQRIVDAT